MNPISLSNVFSTAAQDGAGLMVMKKAMDTFKQDGRSMVELLSALPQNAPPHIGQNLDIRA